ncbi:NAD-dependent epimerase/dehydratase family protein [Paenibacillus wynnii]|uniref:NAD-dependent epimerase n=1 Tax=Paenibacillus wynnii TaxID=268407 RepID=A0A098M9W5_9BACL|nr:NAD-dependent epimerase/dehydratase family protein [Paenibacillus wynnii]KGE18327.1 NAD-dependent epimerase [Paenibacillus wynnii]
MKEILITAKNSYIGNAFSISTFNRYSCEFISCRDNNWKEKSFSGYDVVFHVAGIAHIKESKANSELYTKVNRDLTIALAQKAKAEGVKQFIFLSSMSVYGVESGVINMESVPNPKGYYGISKLQAEEHIKELSNENFRIAIVRPPMVYGKNCKGNYPRLVKLALRLPFFPVLNNQRSMIYIDNLSEFISLLIDNCDDGVFLPQNEEYVSTSDMVKLIAEYHGKKVKMTKLFNPLLRLFFKRVKFINKMFGNLTYEKSFSNYCVKSFKDSIRLTEEGS